MSRRVLLAGFGDLACRLARLLLARGDTVFGLRRSDLPVPAGVQALRADLLDRSSLDVLPHRLDAVVCTLTPDSRDEAAYRRVYVDAPCNLLAALGSTEIRWLFASSTAVYEGDDGRRIDDHTPARPESFNGKVLMEAEQTLRARIPSFLALRFSGIYGPGRRMMLRRAATDRVARPHWSNRIHSEDAAAALAFCLDRPALNGSVIASDGCPTREDVVLGWLAGQLGHPPPRLLAVPESGRRIFPKRLFEAGFSPNCPDFRLGYSSLLQETE